MAVGLNPSKQEIDTQAGVVLRNLQKAFNDVREFQYFLAGKTDAQFKALGYSDGTVDPADNDIATLRSAFADADELGGIYRGALTLLAIKDFRTFIRRLWGMGDV